LFSDGNARKSKLSRLLTDGEPCLLDPPFDHSTFPLDQLQFGQPQQIADMIDRIGRALPGQLVVLTQEARQLQRLQVMGEQDLRRVAHDATPLSRSR
jgi:hypothetical protein